MSQIFTDPVNYYVLVAGLTVAVASSLLLFRLGVSIRGSLVGRLIFYLSFAYAFWILTIMIGVLFYAKFPLGIPDLIAFLSLLIGSGLTLYVAIIGFQVHDLIEIHKKDIYRPRALLIPISLGLVIGGLGSIRLLLNNQFITGLFEGLSIQTGLTLLIIGTGLTVFLYREGEDGHIVSSLCGAVVTVVAGVALIGVLFNIERLYAPFPGGGMSAPTAVATIGCGLILLLLGRTGSSKMIITILMLISLILFTSSLALLGHLLQQPELYTPHYLAKMAVPTAIGHLSYAIAILIALWKKI